MKIQVKFADLTEKFDARVEDGGKSMDMSIDDLVPIYGKSAYQIALDHGFIGSEEEWLSSLHGRDGVDGKDGKDGRDGIDGYTPVKGIDYFDGKDGQNGADGYTPIRGEDYWNENDKAEIKGYVDAAILGGEW